MIVVLDTNVLISGLINPSGPPGKIVDWLRVSKIQLAIDDRILIEYKEVIQRPLFRKYFTEEESKSVLAFIEHDSLWCICDIVIIDLPDPKDRCFIEMALSIDVPLITGNKKHFPQSHCGTANIFSPGEFITRTY